MEILWRPQWRVLRYCEIPPYHSSNWRSRSIKILTAKYVMFAGGHGQWVGNHPNTLSSLQTTIIKIRQHNSWTSCFVVFWCSLPPSFARFVGNERCWWWWELGVPLWIPWKIHFHCYCHRNWVPKFKMQPQPEKNNVFLEFGPIDIPERCYFARTRLKQFTHVSYQISIEIFTKGRLFENPKILCDFRRARGKAVKGP